MIAFQFCMKSLTILANITGGSLTYFLHTLHRGRKHILVSYFITWVKTAYLAEVLSITNVETFEDIMFASLPCMQTEKRFHLNERSKL